MIKIENLSFQYGEAIQDKGQLTDINFHVKKGELILLIGKSGCGKTTLTRIINGLCPNFYYGKVTGKYILDGHDGLSMPIHKIGTIAGSVFQDPRSQFFATNTTDELVLGMENNSLTREEMNKRLEKITELMEISQLHERRIFPLSSGEKQQIAIASVCAMQPKLLVLDEPSANLDSDAIEKLSKLLFRLKEMGTTILLSEHRLHYVRNFFDRMILMDKGQITAEYTRNQALALSDKEMETLGLRLFRNIELNISGNISFQNNGFLKAEQISLFKDGVQILEKVNLHAEKGKILAITGKNGAGKSSICRVITGLYKENVGRIILDGDFKKRKQRIRSSFFVQQDADYQLYAPTVADEFLIGKKERNLNKANIEKRLLEIGLANLNERHPLSLSGGQKQRLLLALAAASNKDVLVFDEPTSGLDGFNMRLTSKLLKNLAAEGRCVILITHDMELISEIADSVIFINKGKRIYHKLVNHDDKMK